MKVILHKEPSPTFAPKFLGDYGIWQVSSGPLTFPDFADLRILDSKSFVSFFFLCFLHVFWWFWLIFTTRQQADLHKCTFFGKVKKCKIKPIQMLVSGGSLIWKKSSFLTLFIKLHYFYKYLHCIFLRKIRQNTNKRIIIYIKLFDLNDTCYPQVQWIE